MFMNDKIKNWDIDQQSKNSSRSKFLCNSNIKSLVRLNKAEN